MKHILFVCAAGQAFESTNQNGARWRLIQNKQNSDIGQIRFYERFNMIVVYKRWLL